MAKEDVSHLKVLRNASRMGVATLLSRIMGLVREQVFAYLFGAGFATDAFNVAFRIPNLLRNLFAEGAMSASLVTTFTQARETEGEDRAWRLAGLVFRVLFVSVAILSLLGILLAPQLATLYASAYKSVPGKFELTVRLTRLIFPFFPMVALAAAFMGILNACGVFFLPALASALFNVTSVIIGTIAAIVLYRVGPRMGVSPIEGMAVAVVIGGAVQAFCQLPSLARVGYRWIPRAAGEPVWYRDPALRQMLWLMVPSTVGLAATQVNLLVNTVLATSQGQGAVSWLHYAFRLMQFPIGIFGVSIANAALPEISKRWVGKDYAGVQQTLSQSLKHLFAINLPASAGLIFLGIPIVQILFQYGRFYFEDTRATAMALAMYALGLTAYSAVKVLVPACYALGNTRLPVISSVLTVLLTVILNLLMVHHWGYWSLALGTSMATTFNAVFLLFSVRKMMEERGGHFPLQPLLRAFLSYGAVALAMGGLCFYSNRLWMHCFPDSHSLVLSRLGRLSLDIGFGMTFLWGLARVFKLTELTELVNLFRKKMKKKLSPAQM